MNWIITIYIALLFFVLSPGVLLRIPSKGKLITVAAVHAIVFAIVWHFTGKLVWKASVPAKHEGFREGAKSCPKNNNPTENGICQFEQIAGCKITGYNCVDDKGKALTAAGDGKWKAISAK
jgi:hypothetical protein